MKNLNLYCLILFVAGMFIVSSCSKTEDPIVDPCLNVVCENGGSCVAGVCGCPDGYTGTKCESIDISLGVIALLDLNFTIKELLDAGIPIDDFYGTSYNDGLIFYLTADGTGMVSTPTNLEGSYGWGCIDHIVETIPTVTSAPTNPETIEGARIGDGATNTAGMLGSCTPNLAQNVDSFGEGWFLPSRGELNLIYKNLHQKSFGSFENESYWTSTQNGPFQCWTQSFETGNNDRDFKDNANLVVLAKAF